MGLQQYVQDYDERLVGVRYTSTGPYWMDILQPYLKSEQIFNCPSSDLKWTAGSGTVSYAYNVMYTSGGTAGDGYDTTPPSGYFNTDWGLHMARIETPSETVLFGDGGGSYMVYAASKSSGTSQAVANLTQPYPAGTSYPSIGRVSSASQIFLGRHFEGANYVFVDGHAKWLKMSSAAQKNGYGVMHVFTIQDDKDLTP